MGLVALTWVVKHNAIHVPLFDGERSNRLFSFVLAANTGTSSVNTALVHNDIHHVYDNGPQDWTRLSLVDHISSPTLRVLAYPFAVIRSIGSNRRVYLENRPELAKRIRVENALVVAVVLIGVIAAPRATIAYQVIPMVLGQIMLVLVNYAEHVGCERGHSNDITHGFVNRVLFNVGLHSEHHEFPGRHWSELGKNVATTTERRPTG